MAKRLVILSDLHCGSVYGLTPSGWFGSDGKADALAVQTAPERKACWEWFSKEIKGLGRIDRLVVNGDLIEGKAAKQGGVELLTTDRREQANMAKRIIEFVGAKEAALIFGTAYHAGEGEDWEQVVADGLGVVIGGQDYYDINGTVFDFKHHLSGSSVPHGRHTPLSRERIWNMLWAIRGEFPMADVHIRSHVHYHIVAGGPDWLAMTMPALQTPGTRYGVRRMSGIVDYGFVVFDIEKDGSYAYRPHLLQGKNAPWAQEAVSW